MIKQVLLAMAVFENFDDNVPLLVIYSKYQVRAKWRFRYPFQKLPDMERLACLLVSIVYFPKFALLGGRFGTE